MKRRLIPSFLRRVAGAGAVVGLLAGVGAATAIPAEADEVPAHRVYLISNETARNKLIVFGRSDDGSLVRLGAVLTGGTGVGGGIGSQGAVTVSADGRWVLAVNPGSDQLSLFRTDTAKPTLVATVPSGGDMPISVAVHDDIAYVLNAGTNNNIVGFRIRAAAGLKRIAGGARALSAANAGAAQVGFAPDGNTLVVTQKATDHIDTFAVAASGAAGPAIVNASRGVTPFGFAFDASGHLIVSNANGGAANASSVSSYGVDNATHTLTPISGPVATNQTAACWIAISGNERFAFTTNTGSGSISGYKITGAGALKLLDADGVTAQTGAGPTDFAFSGRYLYTLNSADDSISIHKRGPGGTLTAVGSLTGLGANAVGLAAN